MRIQGIWEILLDSALVVLCVHHIRLSCSLMSVWPQRHHRKLGQLSYSWLSVESFELQSAANHSEGLSNVHVADDLFRGRSGSR